jgi:WD40 repeat protein
MKQTILSAFLGFMVLVLAACTGAYTPTIPTNPVFIPTPTSPVPIPTSTPDPGIISPENVARLVQIKQIGMGQAIGSPVFSSDGKWLYQATRTGVFAFDTSSYTTSRLVASYSGYSYNGQLMALSPDGKTLALGNDLVQVDNGQKLDSLDLPWPGTQAVAFSLNGDLLAREYETDTSGSVARVGVWRLSDRNLLQTLPANPGQAGRLGFSTHGDYLSVAGSSKDSSFDVYDIRTGERMVNWAGQQDVFLPDDRLAVETDGTVRIFDLETGIAEHAFFGRLVGTSPDGKLIAVLSFDQFKIYGISDEQLLGTLEAHSTNHFSALLRFSPDGQTLAAYTADYCCGGIASQTLSLWRMADSTLIKKIDTVSDLFSFSPDGKSLAVTTQSGSTQILDTTDGSLKASAGAYTVMASAVAFLPDGKQLVELGVEDNEDHSSAYQLPLYFYDVDNGALIEHQPGMALVQNPPNLFSADGQVFTPDKLAGLPMQGWIISGCGTTLSPDGKKMAAGYRDANGYSFGFAIWDLNQKKLLVSVSNLPVAVCSLSFSPDGQHLAITFQGDTLQEYYRTVQVWQAGPSRKMVMELEAPLEVNMVTYSPDGRYIAAGSSRGVVVWNASDGNILFTIDAQVLDYQSLGNMLVQRLAFSPDGNLLALGTARGLLALWDIQDGKMLFSTQVTYAPGSICDVAFSPDGRFLAVGSQDGGIHIFGIKSR